jgi:hypothetical protein
MKILGIYSSKEDGKEAKKVFKTVTEGDKKVALVKIIPYTGKTSKNGIDMHFKILEGEFVNNLLFFKDWVKYDDEGMKIRENSVLESFYKVYIQSKGIPKDGDGKTRTITDDDIKNFQCIATVKHNTVDRTDGKPGTITFANISGFKPLSAGSEVKTDTTKKEEVKKDVPATGTVTGSGTPGKVSPNW